MIDLEELERLGARGTEGPWEIEREEIDAFDEECGVTEGALRAIGPFSYVEHQDWYADDSDKCEADARLICALRNAAPELIARLRAAEAVCEAAVPWCKWVISMPASSHKRERPLMDALDEWKAVRGA